MSENIAGKVIVVTGASSGLGEAAVRRLAANGAKLVLGARRADRIKALAAELKLPEDAAVATDVTDPQQVKALIDGAVAKHGRIDVLVNNAGLMPHSPLERGKIEDWKPTAQVARELGLSEQTLANWRKASKAGKLVVGKPVTPQEMELSRLRAENARLQMELEIVKKAAAYFASESL